MHNDIGHLRGRRPVPLYGDSFAACRPASSLCFQDILDSDAEFSEDHYLLNYGAGNYGVDQIFLLFQNSIDLYEDPFVVMSFMILDLDRSILQIRGGQKPYFRIEEGMLKLKGVPINPNPEEYFTDNPPQIKSYIYRRMLYGYLSGEVIEYLRPETNRVDEKKAINEKIILEMIKELRNRDIDFVFLVFHPHWPGVNTLNSESDWRDAFVKQSFEENDVSYIWSKELFRQDSKDKDFSFADYIIVGNGHPTSHFNQLIAEEIKGYVLEASKGKYLP